MRMGICVGMTNRLERALEAIDRLANGYTSWVMKEGNTYIHKQCRALSLSLAPSGIGQVRLG